MNTTTNTSKGFIITSTAGNILCTDGEWYAPMFVGPGARAAKVWKTQSGAERVRAQLGRGGRVEPLR